VLALREQIRATDSRIDDMVFDLYGLTAEERALVLGEAGRANASKENRQSRRIQHYIEYMSAEYMSADCRSIRDVHLCS
jgi:hypothetical protein